MVSAWYISGNLTTVSHICDKNYNVLESQYIIRSAYDWLKHEHRLLVSVSQRGKGTVGRQMGKWASATSNGIQDSTLLTPKPDQEFPFLLTDLRR